MLGGGEGEKAAGASRRQGDEEMRKGQEVRSKVLWEGEQLL